ncbi:MAG: GGDEF domain-containing phosphodiesterase, partial [Treponema sp.]
SISSPFVYRNNNITVTATFGIVQFPKDGANSNELLQRADMAMYKGKAQGKGRISFFNEEMQKALEERLSIETNLHTAIENNEMYLEYQPQFEPHNHKLRGFEALARWTSPTLGHVSPGEFIPIAEETGDIVPMGKWIMETACTQYMSVYDSYEIPPILAINISAVQLKDPDFVDSIKRIINKTKMDTDHLELEITESVCIMSPEIIAAILSQLKNVGIEIAMDDFGTGYSSLSYLKNLPFDIVKIDITFTKTILTTPPEKNLIKPIIAMAHQLGLKVIAEGVEENAELEYLVANGCDYIQGNIYGRPAPIGAL